MTPVCATIWRMLALVALLGGGAVPLAALASPTPSACGAPAEMLEAGAPLPKTARVLAARPGAKLRLLVVGSASVTGAGTSGPEAAWPQRLSRILEKLHPGLTVSLTVRGGRGLTAVETAALIEAEQIRAPADLVLWQSGTVEAVRSLDVDLLRETLNAEVERLQAQGSDVVLVDPQFSRFLRANANVDPYRDAMRLVASARDVPLLRRYELMRFWAESDRVDLERAPREMRVIVADRLHICLAEAAAVLIGQGAAEALGKVAGRP
jgi:hypothetical protein